ncbi:MAG: DUF4342 domain-containing protein [Bacteroidetes bacterium]|jgi:hypothetical protein|nr:DUF4342 domain-containing protein [Bacteroidota bacterium]PKP35103.1 MAG: hypothetical protein CVU00_03965 [Bacteroidetes bacterium HGW-Bacteroidetes-17]
MDIKEEFKVKGSELLSKIKELIEEGNVHRIIVKDDKGGKFIDIPVNIGIVAVVLAPFMALIASLAIYASTLTIEVIRKEE